MALRKQTLVTNINQENDNRMAVKTAGPVAKVTRGAMKEVGNKLKDTKISATTQLVKPKVEKDVVTPGLESPTTVIDPYMFSEYIFDIVQYLRVLEEKYAVRDDFLNNHKTTPPMRAKLVNWLVEVHCSFNLCLDTLYICISVIDRYLDKNKNVGKSTLQLVGTAALFLSCKYEEVYCHPLENFVYICDDTFSASCILKMERDIFRQLDFSLGKPTAIQFLRRYSQLIEAPKEQHAMGKYLLELMLVSYTTCHIRPSLQAAAACCLALAITSEIMEVKKVWNSTLITNSTYEYADLRPVMIDIAQILVDIERSGCQSVKDKYASSKYYKISLNNKLTGVLIRKLASNKKQSK